VKSVLAAGFTFANMAPAEIVLSRHVEYLRADTKLKAFFGGSGADGRKIRHVPLGNNLEIGGLPMLFAMIPTSDRQPAPGAFTENITVRDVMRFQTSTPTGDEPLYEPGIWSVVNCLIGVVTAPGARQLNYTTVSHGTAQLCTRVDLVQVNVIPLDSPQPGPGANVFDVICDFQYKSVVSVGADPRLWPLHVLGE